MHTAEAAHCSSDAPSCTDRLRDDPSVLLSPVLCADGRLRCPWALSTPDVLDDHDTSWGIRPQLRSEWFRALSLEILQAGLAPGASVSRLPALEAVTRLRAAEAGASDLSVTDRLLDAISRNDEIPLGIVDGRGGVVVKHAQPLSLEGGRLRAREVGRDEEFTVLVHRVTLS